MDTASLMLFADVMRTGGFTAAARERGVAASTVSRAIAALERELGVRLFERSRKGVALTQFGEVFLHYAGASLAALKQGLDSVAQARMSGESYLNVGVLPSVARSAPRSRERCASTSRPWRILAP